MVIYSHNGKKTSTVLSPMRVSQESDSTARVFAHRLVPKAGRIRFCLSAIS